MTINISRRRAIQGAAVAVLSASPIRFVMAGGMTGGALEVTQIANNVELVMQYAKQIEQYATQLQQWRDQLTQAMNIPNQIWSAIQQDIMGVVNVVKQGQALAFSLGNIGEVFKTKFKGYQPTTKPCATLSKAHWKPQICNRNSSPRKKACFSNCAPCRRATKGGCRRCRLATRFPSSW